VPGDQSQSQSQYQYSIPPQPVEQYPALPEPVGRLVLRVEPGTAQVYIDGFYAGTVRDFDRPGGLAVEAGPHHVEIQAPGYVKSAFQVNLPSDREVTYSEDLQPVNGRKPTGAGSVKSAAPPAVFYFIPGCYLGNIPPAAADLPRGCSLDQLRPFNPGR
jgi:hypothetical protein